MKQIYSFSLLTFLLSFTFHTAAWASWSDIPAEDFTMAPPPQKGSLAYKKDFEILLKYQESNREEACELARSQPYGTYEEFFFDSSLLSRREYERAEDLVTRAMKYAMKISAEFKSEYTRVRPYDADARIKPCARKPGGARSYPSSHAAAGVVGACTLAAIYPRNASEIKEYGKYLGDIRFMVGVHHPSDVAAGQTLGRDICRRLLRNPEFKAEIEKIK